MVFGFSILAYNFKNKDFAKVQLYFKLITIQKKLFAQKNLSGFQDLTDLIIKRLRVKPAMT